MLEQNELESKIETVKKNLEEINQYHGIENDNTSLLLKMIVELKERVEMLEKKTV